MAFAIATILEVASYYIPWVDNFMDSVAAPVAVIADTVLSASSIVHVSPLMKCALAIIAGGGTAAIFHGATRLVRGASTSATGGLGNHAVATTELGIASGLSLLAISWTIWEKISLILKQFFPALFLLTGGTIGCSLKSKLSRK